MNKVTRKIMALCTAVMMILAMVPASVSAADRKAPEPKAWGLVEDTGDSLWWKNLPEKSKKQPADADTVTVILEGGKGHEWFVKEFFGPEGSHSSNGIGEVKGTKVYLTVPSDYTISDMFSSLRLSYGAMSGFVHNKEMLHNIILALKPIQEYSSNQQLYESTYNWNTQKVSEGLVMYFAWLKPVTKIGIELVPPKCGTEVTGSGTSFDTTPDPVFRYSGEAVSYKSVYSSSFEGKYIQKPQNLASPTMFTGTIKGNKDFYAYSLIGTKFGYYVGSNFRQILTLKGCKLYAVAMEGSSSPVPIVSFRPVHDLGAAKVTKEATLTSAGKKVSKCKICGDKITETIPKLTAAQALEKGASEKDADKVITSMKNDKDPKGSKFAPLKLKSTKQTKKSVTLTWKKVSGAKKYVIYGNKCGKKNKMKKLTTVKKNSAVMKKVLKKKVKKATYYKFIVVAINKKGRVVSTSKVVHAATKGNSKKSNHKGVKISKKILKKAKALKKGKSLKLGAKPVLAKKTKVAKHVALRYESSNTKIATVSAKGVIKAKAKGKCKVYAYAQNGTAKAVSVVVK